MKVKLKNVRSIYIKEDFIKLDSLLKYASIASTGGQAKIFIKDGNVFVNGKSCLERGKKIRSGDIVRFENDVLRICKLTN